MLCPCMHVFGRFSFIFRQDNDSQNQLNPETLYGNFDFVFGPFLMYLSGLYDTNARAPWGMLYFVPIATNHNNHP